jgi:predicted branched-subunit amino acid permease
VIPAASEVENKSSTRADFWRGAVAILPLWLGVFPFAIAYAVLARTDHFTSVETIALSLFVFAGSPQLAFVRLAGDGVGWPPILLTVLVLNARHVLYGLSLDRSLPKKIRPSRR